MTIECWPRNVDPITDPNGQYNGWQKDNYARKATGYLKTLNLNEIENPLISVYNESTGELEYASPVNRKSFKPKVFSDGKHSLVVRDQNSGMSKTYAGLTLQNGQPDIININFAE